MKGILRKLEFIKRNVEEQQLYYNCTYGFLSKSVRLHRKCSDENLIFPFFPSEQRTRKKSPCATSSQQSEIGNKTMKILRFHSCSIHGHKQHKKNIILKLPLFKCVFVLKLTKNQHSYTIEKPQYLAHAFLYVYKSFTIQKQNFTF